MSSLAKTLTYIVGGVILCSCSLNERDLTNEYQNKSVAIVGIKSYKSVRKNLEDTLSIWILNRFPCVEAETKYPFKIDSLLCFNKEGNRFVGCRHLYVNIPNATADELQFYYGENIKNNWYFFQGATVIIPRSMLKNHKESIALSYEQLHHLALKEVYSGYLDSYGNINEEWFKRHFENVGMCANCKTRADFQRNIVEGVAVKWANRDTTQPIKRLDKDRKLP